MAKVVRMGKNENKGAVLLGSIILLILGLTVLQGRYQAYAVIGSVLMIASIVLVEITKYEDWQFGKWGTQNLGNEFIKDRMEQYKRKGLHTIRIEREEDKGVWSILMLLEVLGRYKKGELKKYNTSKLEHLVEEMREEINVELIKPVEKLDNEYLKESKLKMILEVQETGTDLMAILIEEIVNSHYDEVNRIKGFY